MKKMMILLAGLLMASSAWPQAKFLAAKSNGIQGEYLVVLEDWAAGKTNGLKAAPRRQLSAAIDDLIADYGGEVLKHWRKALPAFLVRLPDDQARVLAMDPRVRLVEQNRLLPAPPHEPPTEALPAMVRRSFAMPKGSCPSAYCQPINCPDPTLPSCQDNWGLDRIDGNPGDGSYGYNATGFGVHVFIFDLALLTAHSEFGDRVLVGFDRGLECDPAAGCELEDLAGNSHGSRVASIVGGETFGVAKDVFLHPVILFETTEGVLEAFEWIVEHRDQRNLGPTVINTSWNEPKLDDDPIDFIGETYCVSMAVRNVVETHGIPVVVSAGNRDTTPLDFSPSDMGYIDGVIVAGGIDHLDQRWIHDDAQECANLGTCGSNSGPGIDLWSPAHLILAATSSGSTQTPPTTLSGTSFAAPHVTGAAALYLQQNPNATPAQVEAAILAGAVMPSPPLSGIGNSPNLLLNTGFIADNSAAAIPPVARADTTATPEGQSVELDVLYNDLDPNGRSLQVTAVSSPPNGTAVHLGNGIVRYTPEPGFDGSDGFSYTVRDESFMTANGTVTITVAPDLPPVALDDHLMAPEDNSVSCPACDPSGSCFRTSEIINNDSDPEGSVTFLGFTSGNLTEIVCAPGSTITMWQFVPSLPAPSTEQFTYTVEDAAGQQDTATLYITTTTSTAHPQAVDDTFYTDAGMARSFSVLLNDPQANLLSLDSVTPPENGTASISGSSVTYTPNPGFTGLDGFTYLVSNAQGEVGAARVTVQVGGNSAPIARHDCFATDVDEVVTFEIDCGGFVDIPEQVECLDLLTNDSDPDGDPVTFVGFTPPAQGSLQLNGTTFQYTPPAGWEGEAHFTYTISDGEDTAEGTAVIGVGDLFPPSDPGGPDAVDDSFTTPLNTVLQIHFATLLANDTGTGLSVVSVGQGSHGNVVCGSPSGCIYLPDAGFVGVDTFSYTIEDANDQQDTANITVTVTGGPEMTIGEVGQVTVQHVLHTVMLSRSYTDPVVFAQPLSFNGGDTSVIRITDVQADRFTLFLHEAPDRNGPHFFETVSYLVLEAGRWDVADGTLLEVGKTQTSAQVGLGVTNQWTHVPFESPFGVTPQILTQVQSNNNPHWVKTRQRLAGPGGVDLALEEEEASSTLHGFETVGWMAIETALGTWSQHEFLSARISNTATHVWQTFSFGGLPLTFSQPPRFLAAISTYNGADGSALRYRNLTAASVEFKIEEDTTADAEISHIAESVDALFIEGNGTLTGRAQP